MAYRIHLCGAAGGFAALMGLMATSAQAETGVSANAPGIVFYAGIGEDCCGEDPHAVHGLQTPDGGYVIGGKSIDSGGQWEGFAVKVGPPDPSGSVYLSKDEGDSYSWSVTFGTAGKKDGVNNLAATGTAVFLGGFKAVADDSQDAYLAKHDVATGSVIWEMSIPESTAGTSSAFEVLQITPDGGLIGAGVVDAPKDGLEGFKSYGNPTGGKGFLMYFSAAQIAADVAPTEPTWSRVYSDVITVKGARPVSDAAGGFILVGANEEEISTLIRTDGQGVAQWTKSYAGRGEPTDVAVVGLNGLVDGFVFNGHGGDGGTLDGHLTKVTTDGTIAWSKAFGDPIGGVGVFAGLGAGNPKLIYDECWGIQGLPDGGMVTACGTGIEGCEPWEAGSDIRKECDQDPRSRWRGMVTRFDAKGEKVWQRVDSFMPPDGGEVASSASEYVNITANGGFLSVVDEGFGLGVLVLEPESAVGEPGGASGSGGSASGGSSSAASSSGCHFSDRRIAGSGMGWCLLLCLGALRRRRRPC